MRRAGWIEETASPRLEDGDERRRYYRVTAAGRAAARHESERLRQLVLEARSLRLLSRRR
jgi:DNA-binding PadR family transcriptional regulator